MLEDSRGCDVVGEFRRLVGRCLLQGHSRFLDKYCPSESVSVVEIDSPDSENDNNRPALSLDPDISHAKAIPGLDKSLTQILIVTAHQLNSLSWMPNTEISKLILNFLFRSFLSWDIFRFRNVTTLLL